MTGETNLSKLLKEMSPELNPGTYVFTTVDSLDGIDRNDILGEFKEAEGITLIMEKRKANHLKFSYDFVVSWITLKVHSSLEAVGLTASFSAELAKHGISCNVIAGYYHDHIFVAKKDETKAMEVLKSMTKKHANP